jgi:hypothetical protein
VSTPIDPNTNQEFWNNVNRIASAPNGLTAPKPAFTYPKPTNIVLPYPSLPNASGSTYFNGSPVAGGNSSSGNSGAATGGTDALSRLMRAIKGQESSGQPNNGYGAYNTSSGADGAYQILDSNIPSWSQQALGHSISTQEFRNTPSEQDAIAKYMLGRYLNQYGLSGAAAAWYGGPGAVSHMNDKTPYGNYPSMYDYVQSILSKY